MSLINQYAIALANEIIKDKGRLRPFLKPTIEVLVKEGFAEDEVLDTALAMFADGRLKPGDLLADHFMERGTHQPEPSASTGRWASFTATRHMNGWEKRENATGLVLVVLDQYWSLKEPKLIRALIKQRLPWFDNFKWDVYGTRAGGAASNDVYLKVSSQSGSPHRSLYVPISALIAKDWAAIAKRHIDYHESFYGNTPERREKFLPGALAVLETPEALALRNAFLNPPEPVEEPPEPVEERPEPASIKQARLPKGVRLVGSNAVTLAAQEAGPALLKALEGLVEVIRQGPPEVIGMDANGELKKAFDHGWNANTDRLWNAAEKARSIIINVRSKEGR